MKKLLTLIMSLCMVLTMMPMCTVVAEADGADTTVETAGVWVGGTNVVDGENTTYWKNDGSDGIDGITATDANKEDYNVMFTPAIGNESAKLTLNDAKISKGKEVSVSIGSVTASIYANITDLEIVANGNNTVYCVDHEKYCYAIYVNGNLTVSGTGKLQATGGDTTTSQRSVWGVQVDGNLTVTGKLEAIGGTSDLASTGASATGKIQVSGTLNGTGNNARVGSYGVEANEEITVLSGSLTGTASKVEDLGASSGGVNGGNTISVFSGGTLKGIGGTAKDNSYGVRAREITISGGDLEGTGGNLEGTEDNPAVTKASSYSYGIFTIDGFGKITINSGTVTAESTSTNATSQAIDIMPTKGDNTTWEVYANAEENATPVTDFDIKDLKYIKFVATETQNPSTGGGSYIPLIPTITTESGDQGTPGGTATYDSLTNKVIITPAEGYQVKDVIVNGESKGAVTELTGIYGWHTVKVVFEKKAPEKTPEQIQAEKDAKITAGVRAARIIYPDANKLKSGNVKLTWKITKGFKMDYYEIYRSYNKNTGFTKFFETKNKYYINSKNLKSGKNLYYKVRGVRKVGDIKVYTNFSRVEKISYK